jgi:aspartate/glutamate racemase
MMEGEPRRILEAWAREDPSSAPSIGIDGLDAQRALQLVDQDRPGLIEYLLTSLRRLAGAGADCAAMTANTPQIVFDELAARSPVPLVSIVEVCAEEARRLGLCRLALLGTRFTMEGPFYPAVCAPHGITIVTPNDSERAGFTHAMSGSCSRGSSVTRRDSSSRRSSRGSGMPSTSTPSCSAGRSCRCSCPRQSSQMFRRSTRRDCTSPRS